MQYRFTPPVVYNVNNLQPKGELISVLANAVGSRIRQRGTLVTVCTVIYQVHGSVAILACMGSALYILGS